MRRMVRPREKTRVIGTSRDNKKRMTGESEERRGGYRYARARARRIPRHQHYFHSVDVTERNLLPLSTLSARSYRILSQVGNVTHYVRLILHDSRGIYCDFFHSLLPPPPLSLFLSETNGKLSPILHFER